MIVCIANLSVADLTVVGFIVADFPAVASPSVTLDGGADYGLAYHPIPPVLVERDWSRECAPPARLT